MTRSVAKSTALAGRKIEVPLRSSKNPSLQVVNGSFEKIFNAAFASIAVFQRFLRACWWVVLPFVGSGLSHAESIADAYQAKIIVAPPQNQAETTAALREAFLVALVRVSGQPKARDNKYLLGKADKVEMYVDRYSYQTLETPLTTAEGSAVPAKELTVNFAPRLINQILSEANLTISKTNRPLILVLTKDEENSFASTTRPHTLSVQLQNELYRRGLSIVLPKMDADDLLALGATYTTLSDDQWTVLLNRYHYQAVLIGELTQHDKEGVQQWLGKWQLTQNDRITPFTQEGKDQKTVISQMADQIAGALMPGEAQANLPHECMIYVKGIHDEDEYKMVRQYLEHLSLVKQVKFVKLEKDTVVYQVTSDAGLEKLINSESSLIPDTQNKNTGDELYYEFNISL